MKVSILMTYHNRKAKTLACLDSIISKNSMKFDYYVVDDGSTDGTSDEIKSRYPFINIIRGDGNLFWNKGMYLAFSSAVKNKYDYYIWVNDDVEFYEGIFDKMLTLLQKCDEKEIILAGSTVDRDTKMLTYGGVKVLNKYKPLNYTLVEPGDELKECDTMNGNCVIISSEVVDSIGIIDEKYHHSYGDYDYGLRAKKVGAKLYVYNGIVGTCSRNSLKGTINDDSLSVRQKLKLLKSPKGFHYSSWIRYCRKYTKISFIYYSVAPLLKILGLKPKIKEVKE